MDLHNFKASLTEQNVYILRINGVLSSEDVSGKAIANEISYLNQLYKKDNNSVKRIDIEINSEGGSIMEGIKIASEVVSSEVLVRTINKGYACSMSGVIFLSGKERHMTDFGLVMIHNPRYQGTDLKDIEEGKNKEAMLRMKDQLMTLIINRCGIDKDKLSDMMDKETWLNYDECKKLNFVDGDALVYSNKPKLEGSTEENILQLNSYYNSLDINFKQKSKNKMEKEHYENILKEKDVSIASLKDEVSAKDTEFKNLSSEYENIKSENEALNEEIANAIKTIKAYEDEKAEKYVSNVIEKGLFAEDSKEELLEMAKNDLEKFETFVNMIRVPEKKEASDKPKISSIIEMSEAVAAIEEDNLNGLTKFEHLQKNDPNKLKEIRNKNNALYVALEKEFIEKNKN